MYQLEVKRFLIEYQFPPTAGWEVTVDIDAMERARGGVHPQEKRGRAKGAERWLREQGVRIGKHPEFGRADVVALRKGEPLWVVEVEGDSSKQREQAMYSALGQAVLSMGTDRDIRFGLAVPDAPEWEAQLKKIPVRIKKLLSLELWLVAKNGIRSV